MESLVVTLDTAKQLKAAGFPQETVMAWRYVNGGDFWQVMARIGGLSGLIAAPTAQEIIDQLPTHAVNLRREGDGLAYARIASKDWMESALTIAEALAALWLKLNGEGE